MTSSRLSKSAAFPSALKDLKKILLIRFSSIGDIILTEPVSRVLRLHYPDAQIDYVTKQQYKDIPGFFPYVNEVITGDNTQEIVRRVRREKYDLVLELHKKMKPILIKIAARSSVTNSYNKKRSLRRSIIKKKKQSIGSTVALYLSSLDFLKLGDLYDKETLDVNEAFYPQLIIDSETTPDDLLTTTASRQIDNRILQRLLSPVNEREGKHIAIFPGALHPTKQYPPSQISEAVNSLPANETEIYLLGAPDERELCNSIAAETGRKINNWCGMFNLNTTIKLMNCFDLIVTNDSGPMHIAAALGKKQIAIYGATDPVLGFKPHNQRAVMLGSKLACRPCSLHGDEKCPEGHFKCMKDLQPEVITKHITELLKES